MEGEEQNKTRSKQRRKGRGRKVRDGLKTEKSVEAKGEDERGKVEGVECNKNTQMGRDSKTAFERKRQRERENVKKLSLESERNVQCGFSTTPNGCCDVLGLGMAMQKRTETSIK